jgi:glycerol-3-phosphate dehydrogenase
VRSLVLRELAARRFEVLIVGGGIHGAFAAWDAALRGWSVALIERGDFGAATSGNSLGIVHGGFRYLQTGDLARLRESARERATLMRMAPKLVEALPCVTPTGGPGLHSRIALAAALRLAALLSADGVRSGPSSANVPLGRTLPRAEYEELTFPLAVAHATGGALWYDALVRQPARLLIEVIRSATDVGGLACNYVQSEGLVVERGTVVGVNARALPEDEVFTIRSRAVLNAAGPWAGPVLAGVCRAPRVALARGCNVVLRRTPPHAGAAIPFPAERRMLFAVPAGNRLVLGTQYSDAGAEPGTAARAVEADVDRLLAAANEALPGLGLTGDDIALVQQGYLPRAQRGSRLLERPLFIDHAAADGVSGVLTVIGVKWTTARVTAEHALDRVQRSFGQTPRPGGTDRCALFDGRARELQALIRARPEIETPLVPGCAALRADIVHAFQAEAAFHLDDALRRRTGLGAFGHPGEQLVRAAADVAAAELGWSPERVRDEIARVNAIYARPP